MEPAASLSTHAASKAVITAIPLDLNALATTLAFWSDFNFPRQRVWLDAMQVEVAERQERSAKARKALSEETKEFKKDPKADFAPLLRSYQKEIDEVTKRARAAESALAELYKALRDAPDPAAWLEETSRLEAESATLRFDNAKLSAEVADFEVEFGKLKNQDITIRQLQDRIAQTEDDMEAKVAEAVEQRASEIEAQAQETTHDALKEWEELRAKADVAEREAVDQRRAADEARSELYDLRARLEERDASRQGEIELLQEELSQLRAAAGAGAQKDIVHMRMHDEEDERRKREDELARAYLALDAARLEAARSREIEQEAARRREREAEEARAQLNDRLARERDRVAELEAQLARALTERLQREEPVAAAPSAAEERARDLEAALATARLQLADKEREARSLREAQLRLEERVDDQKQAIKRLQLEAANALQPAEGNGHADVMREQRDRFRRRMLELESELDAQASSGKRLHEQVERLRGENAGLSERLRMARSVGGGALQGASAARTEAGVGAGIARIILGSPLARSMVAGYFFVLHLLVMASTHSSAHDAASLRGKGG